MMYPAVRSNKRKMLLGIKRLQVFLSTKILFTVIDLPQTMIQTDAIRASVTQQRGITRTVLRVVNIDMTVHLKPVNVFLLRQTRKITYRRKNDNPLLQLVKPQLYLIIDHAIIADAASIHIRITFIIREFLPQ